MRVTDPGDAEASDLEQVIAVRVREFRVGRGLSLAALAADCELSKAMLSKIENAQTSCSLSTLARLAAALDVPVTALFRGLDTEREAVFTAAGHGSTIRRRGTRFGHEYRLLGSLRGVHRRLEPVLVTLTEQSEIFPQFQHIGSELIYLLEGVVVYAHGDAHYELHPGDALIFDGEAPHGPAELRELPIRFLSVKALE